MKSCVRLFALALLLCSPALVAAQSAAAAEAEDLAKFRADRVTTLLGDNGWFTVAGLHFLNPGSNTFGSDALNDIVIQSADMPARAGTITMQGTTVTIRAVDGTTLDHNGQMVREGPLRLAGGGRRADLVTYGSVSFFLHYSGPRLAIRVRDQRAPLRTNFSGLKWFAPNPSSRVLATFTPLAEPRVVQAPNILGDLEPFTVPGTVTFTLGGRSHTMEAWRSGNQLWFVFRDLTSQDLTYPSARFLYTNGPAADGTVVMDFNRAVNPPCAYNPWTTCPLPPTMNRLPIRIEAGEQRYHAAPTSNSAVLGRE
jgi:uncharacterized protein (DUF1684 family)